MSRVALSDTGDWQLKHSEHDIRGKQVLDHSGARIGTVDEMIVNTNDRRVDTLVLDDGREIPAREVAIEDGTVYVSSGAVEAPGGRVAVYDTGEVVERKEVAPRDFDAHKSDFRKHYDDNYGSSGRDFSYYEPAYRYGYESAHEDSYRNRGYSDAEDDLRRNYESRHPGSNWDEMRGAVRHGYHRARRGRR